MAIYVPTRGVADGQALLADPKRHWRTGCSARTLAACWESAAGIPAEIDVALGGDNELLIAIPEHKVPLPGGRRPSQCDLFALVRRHNETISVAVEGKVNESFGPLVSDWLADPSAGRRQRLSAITAMLGCAYPPPGHLNYQLFHRTASAIVEARRFRTDRAAVVVHSFSPTRIWFDAFTAFAAYVGADVASAGSATITLPDGLPLTLAWAEGDARFLAM